jgi:hypothetical protein
MTTCPSRLEIGRFDAAGRTGPLTAHVGSCARCVGVLRELDAVRGELFGGSPQVASAAAARRILAQVAERRAVRRRWLRFAYPLALLPVLGGLLLVAANRKDGDLLLPGVALETGARAKGALALEIVCKRGEEQFPVNEGADFYPGDRLRFAYTKGEPGHLTIFGLDDTGQVFPYYEDKVLSGIVAPAGSRVVLPGSIELDGHRGWERIFALWSPEKLDPRAVEAAVQGALREAGGDVRQVGRLPLPVEQVSYLLRRP